MAYQVKRADFDDLLLRHAGLLRGRGARGDRGRGRALRATGARSACACARAAAPPNEIRAQVVVDASGQGALLSRKLGLRSFDPKLKRAALFAHYEGIRWPAGSRPGDILLPIDQGVWYWIIPFSDGTCSVGGVFDPAEVRFSEGAVARRRSYDELLAPLAADARAARRSAPRSRASTASRTTRPGPSGSAATAGFSSATRRPFSIRSSRPASFSPWRPASAPPARSTGRFRGAGAWTRGTFAAYERQANRMVGRFRKFVYNFYDPVFFEAFTTPRPPEAIRAAVVTTLAGGVERASLGMWFWTRMMFVGVAIDRLSRRLRRAGAARASAS